MLIAFESCISPRGPSFSSESTSQTLDPPRVSSSYPKISIVWFLNEYLRTLRRSPQAVGRLGRLHVVLLIRHLSLNLPKSDGAPTCSYLASVWDYVSCLPSWNNKLLPYNTCTSLSFSPCLRFVSVLLALVSSLVVNNFLMWKMEDNSVFCTPSTPNKEWACKIYTQS